MADSTYRVGVLLDLAAGRYRRGAKAAAKDTDRLGGTLRKVAGNGSLMGRRVAEGSRGARREVRHTAEEAQRLGRTLRRTGRDGEQSIGGLTRRLKGFRTEAGLAVRTAGRLRGLGGLAGILGIGGGGFAIAAGLRRIVTMEERMERLGIQSGRSREEMARLRKEVYATANLPEIRLDPSQVLSAVEAIVEKTGDLEFARDNLLLIAQSIQGSGGTGDALGRLSAELRKLGVADPAGVAQALNLLTAQGKSGAFTLGNMSAQGERLFSAFARLGYEGPGAVRQLGAISQMARQSTGSSEQAATAVEALLRTLSDAQKIDAIWTEFGVNVQDPTGAFRPLDQILKEVVAATGGDPTALSGVFDAEAIRAISGLATPQGMGNYNRFLTIEAPPDMLARDAARIAETTGAQIQETKTDVEDWMQDKLTGPLGEFVTALTSFKDELLVGVGLLAGSWYAFKGLRAAGSLLWRLAGRGGGRGRGGPMGDQVRGSGRGRGGPRGDQVRLSGRGPGGPWGDQVRGSGRGRGGPRGDQVRLSGRGRGGPRGDQVRGSGRGRFGPMGDQVRLSGRGRGGPRGDQVRGSGRGRFGPMGDQVRLSGRGRGGPRGDQVRGSGRGRFGPMGDQVRLSGRGRGGPRGDQVRGSGRGRFGPMGDQVRLSGRGPGGPWGDQVRGSGRGRFGPMGDQVRLSGRGRGGPRGDQVRGSGRGRFGPMGDQVRLSGRGPGGPWGDQVRGSGRGRFGPMGDQVRLSGRGRGGPMGDQVRLSGRGRGGPMGDQVRLSGRGRGGPMGDQVRGSGRGRFGPMGDQVRGSGRGRGGPRGRLSTGGGLFRLLSRGLGPASAGAMMGLTAHDIATGAVLPDQVAPEVGGLMGGLGGSWMAAVGAGKLMKSLPGPIRFGGSLLAGLGGYMGGESAGRAASDVVFGPMNDPEMWDRTRALHKQYGPRAEESFLGWVQRLAGFGDDPLDRAAAEMSSGALEIGNWRGVGRDSRRRNRGRLDIGRNRPEVWTPPVPEELEPAASRRNRGRLGIGRNEVTVNVGPITVQSGSADPREVAEEVADEIERRVRDRSLGLRDVLLADPTPEAVY